MLPPRQWNVWRTGNQQLRREPRALQRKLHELSGRARATTTAAKTLIGLLAGAQSSDDFSCGLTLELSGGCRTPRDSSADRHSRPLERIVRQRSHMACARRGWLLCRVTGVQTIRRQSQPCQSPQQEPRHSEIRECLAVGNDKPKRRRRWLANL